MAYLAIMTPAFAGGFAAVYFAAVLPHAHAARIFVKFQISAGVISGPNRVVLSWLSM